MEEQSLINEKPNITQFSWWVDPNGRIWVVHAIWINQNKPTTILLLRFGGHELVERPYETIQELIETQTFKQISPILNAHISINSSGSGFTATAY